MNETDRRIVAVFVKFLQEKLQRNQLAEAQAESVDGLFVSFENNYVVLFFAASVD